MKDYHTILGIAANSDKSEIQKAYRKLAKKYHPDVNKSLNAQDKFIEISEAYEFLINQLEHPDKVYNTASANVQDNLSSQLYQEFERLRQEAREKAQKQAKMRYEEFKKQHEAFQISGINDLALLFTIIVRIAIIPLFLFLLLLPVYIALNNEWTMIFLFIATWPFAFGIGWYIYDKRSHYFKPGNFYYSFHRIRQLYTESNLTEQKCFYCPAKSADSKPYKVVLLKLKDIKLKTGGFRQHNVNYINKEASIMIPRSKKAFIVHSINIFIKILAIVLCLIFLNISSLLWKFIIGMLSGGLISKLILLFTFTKSNVSYLFSYGTAFRVSIWLFVIILFSNFSVHPFNINTSDFVYITVTAIVLFDCLLMQLVNLTFGKYASMPIIRQYGEVEEKIKNGFRVYNDVTIISVVYPIYRWIFG